MLRLSQKKESSLWVRALYYAEDLRLLTNRELLIVRFYL
jgi:hypothetical protein